MFEVAVSAVFPAAVPAAAVLAVASSGLLVLALFAAVVLAAAGVPAGRAPEAALLSTQILNGLKFWIIC